MNQSQFSLRWNSYVQHVTDAFRALRSQDDLVDVTLCCDGHKIKAHKVLLSACSAYFREIFKENPCRHPIVIFRNVKYEDLNAIVQFMYNGEVNILHEQLESFLITAEMLEVNGLTDGFDDEEEKTRNIPETWQFQRSNNDISAHTQTKFADPNGKHVIDEPINLATTQAPKVIEPVLTKLNEIPKLSSFDNSFNGEETSPVLNDFTQTKLSGMITQATEEMQIDNQNIDESSERNHASESDLAKFRCQLCPKGFKHPTSLTLHRDSHTGKTQCPVCHRSFSRSYDMRSHLQKIHQGKNFTIKEIKYKSNENTAQKTFNPHV